MKGRLWAFLAFRDRRARAAAFFAFLVAAILSPNVGMPAGLPAIRAEQLLLVLLLPSLAWYHWRDPEARRLNFLDGAFAAMGFSFALTLVYAPLRLPGVSFSLRDPFELARLAEYWLAYRLGLSAAVWPGTARGLFAFAGLAALGGGAFALVQYLEPDGFNEAVTAVWTPARHLDALDRTGRAVGTVGNSNYFGLASGLFLSLCLAAIVLRTASRRWAWLAYAGTAAAVLGLVLSQSRTATFATLAALGVGFAALVLTRGKRAAYLPATAVVLVAAAASIAFVELVPPDFGSYHARFAPRELTEGSSLGIRLSRWRSIFAGFSEGGPAFCETGEVPGIPPERGHEPAAAESGADAAARERDARRKADVQAVARAILRSYCDRRRWPVDEPLAEVLVPRYLAALPSDPLTGEPYAAYVASGGFTVVARLEDPGDPEGPWYTVGTLPNMVLNPSFESGRGNPDGWRAIQGASAAVVSGGRYGSRAAHLVVPPGGLVYQNVVFEFALHRPYAVGIWAKASGERPQSLQLYLAGDFADGPRRDPFVTREAEIPADGAWHHVGLTFETGSVRMTTLQVILRGSGGAPLEVLVDGATLNEGPLPLAFPTAVDVDPARLVPGDLPTFADSPLLGVGPRKDIQLGAVDNEYALFLDRYGLAGTAAYVVLLLAGAFVGWRAYRRSASTWGSAAGFALAASFALLAVFNVAAGSFYHFQLMAIVWGWAGAAAGFASAPFQPGAARSFELAEVSRA